MKKIFLRIVYTILLTFSIHSVMANEVDEDQLAPDFSLQQLNGTLFKLSDYRGKKAVYLVFWNTWCAYCIKKIPMLKTIQTQFTDKIKLIAINTSRKDSVHESKQFQQQFNINYALAFDHNKKVTSLYQVFGVPTAFIIDINGVIRYRDGIPTDISPYLAKWNQKQ